jgi:hypothetical protein
MPKGLSFHTPSLTSILDHLWHSRVSRIQQACYTLIPEDELPSVHLQLARTLRGLILQPQPESGPTPEDLQDDTSIFVQLTTWGFSNYSQFATM